MDGFLPGFLQIAAMSMGQAWQVLETFVALQVLNDCARFFAPHQLGKCASDWAGLRCVSCTSKRTPPLLVTAGRGCTHLGSKRLAGVLERNLA
eukprot:scaffold151216_cov20-Tisochrysis_lutea.AAC.2